MTSSFPEGISTNEHVWLEEDEDGRVRVHPLVEALCRRVGELATELSPAFVKSRYAIEVEATRVQDWDRRGPVDVHLRAPARGRTFELDVVGSGTAVWIGYAIAEALRMLSENARELHSAKTNEFRSQLAIFLPASEGEPELPLYAEEGSQLGLSIDDPLVRQHIEDAGIRLQLKRQTLKVTFTKGGLRHLTDVEVPQETLFVFDEPERHLNPAAQEQAATWIGDLIGRGAHVILASHSPAFLNLRTSSAALGAGGVDLGNQLEDVQYLRVYRDNKGRTRTEALSAVMAQHLDKQAQALGLSRAQLVQLTRAVLVVEGAHDERVINHCYGDVLSSDRIFVLPLRGATKAKLLAEAEFLRALHLPMILLFDNTADGGSPESSEIARLHKHWPSDAPPPQVVRFAPRDIIVALPDEHVGRALHSRWGTSFPGWAELLSRFDKSKETNLKGYLLKSLRLPSIGPDEFLDEILRATPRAPLVGSELDRAIEQVRALARSNEQWFGTGDTSQTPKSPTA